MLFDFSVPLFRDNNPLQIVGPGPGNPTMIREFRDLASWRDHVLGLRLRGGAPTIFQQKHDRVLQLLFLAWMEPSIIKLAELGALATLEATIKARYPEAGKSWSFSKLLDHLVKQGNLVDSDLPVSRESGCAVVSNLLSDSKIGGGPGLNQIRNRLAHGDPFETMPWAGLFEVVRDVIDFMYPASTKP